MTDLRRTNIYLAGDQLRALKLLAADSNRSVADHVREAVDEYLARRVADEAAWRNRFEEVITRIRSRLPGDVPEEEIEAEITAARAEVRASRRAARGH